MAPIKLEDHIREEFEEREIAPSAGAWDKLEAQLDKEQGKKRPLFIWYAIAASIVGIVFIASQFFFNEDATAKQQLVDVKIKTPIIKEVLTSEILKTETQLVNETQVQESKVAPVNMEQAQRSSIATLEKNKSQKVQKEEIAVNNANEVRLAVQERANLPIEHISEVINKEMELSSKVDEVVAAVHKMQEERSMVSAAEIDALLRNAQRDLATDRILNEIKIDATALLEDIEFELEKSFRDKVFDALGDNFSKIRTAVVERNN
jgi:hypothetical protein